MTYNVKMLAESMDILKKYNPEATVEFWDGYMIVFGKEVGEVSNEDKLKLFQLGWKEPEECESLSLSAESIEHLKDIGLCYTWEYGW